MIVGTAAERPVILAPALLDRDIVDAGDAKPHQAVLVELPILVAVAAEPKPAIIVPLIGEAHGDAVFVKGPDFLDQPVIELAVPLARQEGSNGPAPLLKFRAVTPAAVDRVRERDARGIARIPRVLRHACLLRGGLGGKARQRRAVHRMVAHFGATFRSRKSRIRGTISSALSSKPKWPVSRR